MRKYALILLVALTACGSSKTPDTTEQKLARAEKTAQDADTIEARIEVRKLAQEFLKNTLPDWKVEGLQVYRSTGNDYVVSADVSRASERNTFTLYASLFAKDTGELYWKISPAKLESERVKYPNPSSLIAPHDSASDKEGGE